MSHVRTTVLEKTTDAKLLEGERLDPKTAAYRLRRDRVCLRRLWLLKSHETRDDEKIALDQSRTSSLQRKRHSGKRTGDVESSSRTCYTVTVRWHVCNKLPTGHCVTMAKNVATQDLCPAKKGQIPTTQTADQTNSGRPKDSQLEKRTNAKQLIGQREKREKRESARCNQKNEEGTAAKKTNKLGDSDRHRRYLLFCNVICKQTAMQDKSQV